MSGVMNSIIINTYNKSVKGITEELLKNKEKWYDFVLNMPKSEQIVYTIILFHSQIENGGFHQYFFNSFGQFVYLVIKNLEIIKSIKRRKTLLAAINLINKGNLDEDTFRSLLVQKKIMTIQNFDDNIAKSLDKLDSEYFQIENEDINVLLENYLVSVKNIHS
jgi:hypothetical protein